MTEKRTPEVGDVWGLDEYIARVLFVSENSVRYLTPNFVGCHPMIVTREKWWFVRAFKYLGKSKVSIKELFDVEEK